MSAITSFFASPTTMRVAPSLTSCACAFAFPICGWKRWKRLMGPAIIVGKNSMNAKKSAGVCSGSFPARASTM